MFLKDAKLFYAIAVDDAINIYFLAVLNKHELSKG